MLSVVYAECRYAECHYGEYRGVLNLPVTFGGILHLERRARE